MRVGLTVSSVGHVALIAFGMIGLSGTSSYESLQQETLPIDVISMAEYTEITEGVRDGGADIEPQAPEVAEEVVAEVDLPTPEPRRVDEVREAPELEPVEEAAAPEPTAAADSEPEPVAIPEPQPEPEAPAEPEPRPMLSNAPTPPKRPDSPEPEPEQTPEPEPQSDPIAELAAEPVPEPETPVQRESEFSADRISALLNRAPESGGAVDSEAPGETHSLGLQSGRDDTLSISDIDALRRQIARCWNPPVGLQDAGRLVVRLGLELNRDGSLAGAPRILNAGGDSMFTVAAEAAQRAVNRCQPYDLPPEKYDVWREIHVNFDPRELLGG